MHTGWTREQQAMSTGKLNAQKSVHKKYIYISCQFLHLRSMHDVLHKHYILCVYGARASFRRINLPTDRTFYVFGLPYVTHLVRCKPYFTVWMHLKYVWQKLSIATAESIWAFICVESNATARNRGCANKQGHFQGFSLFHSNVCLKAFKKLHLSILSKSFKSKEYFHGYFGCWNDIEDLIGRLSIL